MKDLSKRQIIEFCAGLGVLVLVLILGLTLFPAASKTMLMFRMFIGLAIGYALTRAAMGFAGTVNRAYRTGSTKLMKAIAVAFMFGGIATAFCVLTGIMPVASLPGNTINYGLFIGATLFGFGMAMTICCASGVLTDLAESPLRALVVLFFFCAGGFLGSALKNASFMKSWIFKPIFGIEALGNKVNTNFAHWFKWDGVNGALGGLILTVALCALVIYLATLYEKHRQAKGTLTQCESEQCCLEAHQQPEEEQSVFYRLFVKPWNMKTGAAVLALAFAALMIFTHGGWGVSGPLGQWFARLLHMFGVPTANLVKFSGMGASAIEGKFFQNPMYIQDLSIFVGALVCLLLAGRFTKNPKAWLFNPLEIIFYAFGGLCLGVAINLAKGCNAGGLYTPISSFALSGWIYLICIVVGGWLGNMVVKALYKAWKIK